MFYARSFTIPPDTTWSDPEALEIEIPAGRLTSVFVHGAPEHQHQVAIGIYYLGTRIFPVGEVELFYPSEYPATFPSSVEIVEGARRVQALGINSDDTYEHTVYIGLTVETGLVPMWPTQNAWKVVALAEIGGS